LSEKKKEKSRTKRKEKKKGEKSVALITYNINV